MSPRKINPIVFLSAKETSEKEKSEKMGEKQNISSAPGNQDIK